jgi:hypothetical protein
MFEIIANELPKVKPTVSFQESYNAQYEYKCPSRRNFNIEMRIYQKAEDRTICDAYLIFKTEGKHRIYKYYSGCWPVKKDDLVRLLCNTDFVIRFVASMGLPLLDFHVTRRKNDVNFMSFGVNPFRAGV